MSSRRPPRGYSKVMSRRSYGTGQIIVKSGSYYGRWYAPDGRRVTRKIGPVRPEGTAQGLTRLQVEAAFRKMREEEDRRPRLAAGAPRTTSVDLSESYRRKKKLEGASKSYLGNIESMQRVHIEPAFGKLPVDKVTVAHVERLAEDMLAAGRSPKTVRNCMSYVHTLFTHGMKRGLCVSNPVALAARPKRRRANDAEPDLQFLNVEELEAVIRTIPDEAVIRPQPIDIRGRPGPPPPVDYLGPVLRVLILTAAMTGLRRSELLGLR